MKLVYWGLPARAYIIRLVLHFHGIKIKESMAVLKYCARKAGCIAKTERGLQIQDMFEGYYSNFLTAISKTGAKDDAAKAEFKKNIPMMVAPMEKFMSNTANSYGGKWASGEGKVTLADFFVFKTYVLFSKLCPAIAEHCPCMKKHLECMLAEGDANFKEYYDKNPYGAPADF